MCRLRDLGSSKYLSHSIHMLSMVSPCSSCRCLVGGEWGQRGKGVKMGVILGWGYEKGPWGYIRGVMTGWGGVLQRGRVDLFT